MSLLQPELSPPRSASARNPLARTTLLAGAAFVLVGAGVLLGSGPSVAVDPCALPTGVKLADLDSHDSGLVTRRLLACSDLRHGRITDDQYRSAVAAIDTQWEPAQPQQPKIVWASAVNGFSSQYTTSSWSAAQLLGPPDVFPASGDNAKAWASLGADNQDEWVEVGFDHPGSVSAVEIYETFNPGALERVELVTASGAIVVAQLTGSPAGASMRRTASVGCTKEPIVAVRVHVASMRVAGWNEIDAIGVVPCKR
ncbi:MAG: hypothetical protein ABI867_39505 [Kofleriaceae bacterium]